MPERIRQSETTNYEVNRLVRHTFQPKGTVRRLSVAVILDHQTVYATGNDGRSVSRSEPRSQKDLNAYRELVLAAVGYNPDRGDVVTIENVPFFSESKPEEPTHRSVVSEMSHPYLQPYIMPAIKYGAFIILFLLVYFVLFRPIRKRVFQALAPALPASQEEDAQLTSETDPKALPGTRQEQLGAGEEPSAASLPAADSLDSQRELCHRRLQVRR